jgi:hypothetical protein
MQEPRGSRATGAAHALPNLTFAICEVSSIFLSSSFILYPFFILFLVLEAFSKIVLAALLVKQST